MFAIYVHIFICVLQDAEILQGWEVKVFAAVVVDTQAMTAEELSKIEVTKIDVRGVQLATLFARAIMHFSLANSVCGSPVLKRWVRFIVYALTISQYKRM